jgi:hypothetical protein
MAEEKKTNLRDRLKKTQMGSTSSGDAGLPPPAGIPSPGDVAPPPFAAPFSPPGPGSIPAPSIPGIPAFGGDIAPPPFVQEQQAAARAAEQAAARAAQARAVADDPFGAASAIPQAAPAAPIVITQDGRPVDDTEVGRTRTGSFVAVGVTAVICLGAGYLVGGQREVNSQNRQTLRALEEVRTKAQEASNALATAKTKIEHACERANIAGGGDEQPGQAPTHPPEIDLDLVTWFRQSAGENAPFGPEVFASRMGRLDPNVSQRIAAVHVMFAQLWRDLGTHASATGDGTAVREALTSARDSSALTTRLGMVLRQPQPNAPWVGVLAVAQNLNAQTGQVTLAAIPGVPEPTRPRAVFTGAAALAPTAFGNTYFSVNVTDGLGPSLQRASTLQWLQYRQRLISLKNLITQLSSASEGLNNKLAGRPAG